MWANRMHRFDVGGGGNQVSRLDRAAPAPPSDPPQPLGEACPSFVSVLSAARLTAWCELERRLRRLTERRLGRVRQGPQRSTRRKTSRTIGLSRAPGQRAERVTDADRGQIQGSVAGEKCLRAY